jgi:hypothetical protein
MQTWSGSKDMCEKALSVVGGASRAAASLLAIGAALGCSGEPSDGADTNDNEVHIEGAGAT